MGSKKKAKKKKKVATKKKKVAKKKKAVKPALPLEQALTVVEDVNDAHEDILGEDPFEPMEDKTNEIETIADEDEGYF
jgi:hypothetical protein